MIYVLWLYQHGSWVTHNTGSKSAMNFLAYTLDLQGYREGQESKVLPLGEDPRKEASDE